MKNYLKEIIIILIQVLLFYLFPKLIVIIGPIGLVFELLALTFILSLIIAIISKNKIKYFYSIIVSIIFIPTIWIYYNESALIHSIWYFTISSIGLCLGLIIKKIIHTNKKTSNK